MIMSDYDRQPPQDAAAEQSALGGMLLSPEAITEVASVVGPEDFYRPAHGLLFQVIVDLQRRGEPSDPVTTAAELQRRGELARIGGAPYLHTLISTVPTAANATYYAEIVSEKAMMRRLIAAGTRIVQLGYADVGLDEVDEVLSQARTALDTAVGVPDASMEATSLGDLVCEPDLPQDWVVPGLLERGDRLILSGFEGTGKSVFVAQLALSIAGGIHPFTGDPILPDGGTQQVLIVDVENTRRQLRRRLGRMAAMVDHTRRGHGLGPANWRQVVKVIIRPDGVDLGRAAEFTRLDAECSRVGPDLVVAGPLYKLTGWNTHEEEGALKLLQTLDRIRIKHDCALIAEHHSGHAQGGQVRSTRPIGSSVFLRWPEFGLGIVRHPDADPTEEHPSWVQVRRWRGSREERAWPRELRHGGPDRLPWIPTAEYWAHLPVG
jgi:hypothetical protein